MGRQSQFKATGATVTRLYAEPYDAARLFLRALRLDVDETTLETARNLYREVVRIAPRHAEAWNNLGVVLSKLGDRAGAMDAWGRALEADPDRAETHNNIGSMLQMEMKLSPACVYLGRAVRLDPELSEARVNLALCLQALGKRRSALRHWREYLTQWPNGEFATLARKHVGLCTAR